MKISVNKQDLIRGISIVQKAVSSRPSIPILKGILMVANYETLTLTANDLQIGIETSMTCATDQPGAIVVDAKLLGDVVRHIREEYLTIQVEPDLSIKIQNRDLDISIKGFSNQEFPDLPMISQNEGIAIKEKVFSKMLAQTLFAVADTEYSQIINGVLFNIEEGLLTMAASDGYRFALKEQNIESMNQENYRFVVPGHTLRELRKLLNHDGEQFIRLAVDDNHVVIVMENTRIISRLLEGEYIKYESIIPTQYFTHVLVDTDAFIDALSINSVVAAKQNSSVILKIDKDGIEIKSRSEVGKISKKLGCRVEGEPLTIGFNIRYLTEGIKANEEQLTRISFVKGSKSPGVITSKERYKYLISPVLVNNLDE